MNISRVVRNLNHRAVDNHVDLVVCGESTKSCDVKAIAAKFGGQTCTNMVTRTTTVTVKSYDDAWEVIREIGIIHVKAMVITVELKSSYRYNVFISYFRGKSMDIGNDDVLYGDNGEMKPAIQALSSIGYQPGEFYIGGGYYKFPISVVSALKLLAGFDLESNICGFADTTLESIKTPYWVDRQHLNILFDYWCGNSNTTSLFRNDNLGL